MSQLEAVPNIKTNQLRVEFIHRATKRRWLSFRNYPFSVQNIPYEFGVKITNIGNNYFQGCTIEDFQIKIKESDTTFITEEKPYVKPLNPNESIEIFVDKYTSIHSGPTWIECKFKPQEASIIKAYQYDKNHDSDGACVHDNEWSNSDFIQGKFELLQANTNIQILILTIITVLEAVFGLKNIIQGFFGAISYVFLLLAQAFGYLA